MLEEILEQQSEEVLPGAADRILKMAENEANHRHLIDRRCVGIDSRDKWCYIWNCYHRKWIGSNSWDIHHWNKSNMENETER